MVKLTLLFLLVMWLSPRCHSDMNLTLDNGDDDGFAIDITYSDDNSRIELQSFLMQLYETDGDLSTESTYINIEKACDSFLQAELNAVYSPQHALDLDGVNCTIFSDEKVELSQDLYRLIPEERQRGPSRRDLIDWETNRGSIENLEDERKFLRGKRTLQSRIGSELFMKLNVTFDSTPTPSEDKINEKVKEIMQNLTSFVSNLKATDDEELENVYMAHRIEIPAPTTSPSVPIPLGTEIPAIALPAQPAGVGPSEPGIPPQKKDGNKNALIISLILGVGSTALLVLGALFLVRRRRNDEDFEVSEREALEVLEETLSQKSGTSPGYDTRSVNSDSIFSGLTDILTDTGSPKVRSTKSVSSATTVKANNKKPGFKSPSSIGFKSPSSMAATSTLFAFSEEDEDDISESSKDMDDERTPLSPNGNGLSSCDVTSSALSSIKRENNKNTQNYNHSQEDNATNPKTSFEKSPSKVSTNETNLNTLSASPNTSVLVGGAMAATVVTATAVTMTPKNEKDGQSAVTSPSPKSAKSIKSSDGAFPMNTASNASAIRQCPGKFREDGTSEGQHTIHPMDWSHKSHQEDGESIPSTEKGYLNGFAFAEENAQKAAATTPSFSPHSQSTRLSSLSGTTTPGSRDSKGSDISPSHQLINDLVWLEKKIADVRSSAGAPFIDPLCPLSPSSPGMIQPTDSLSYKSQDAQLSPSSADTSTIGSNGIMQNIICRDCFAPPGKLQIVIHSTKDGPAVHTVKPGSSLEGHIFPGDLIIAVDNVDTRTYSAEQVMKTMASKGDFERKITVLHFEN